MTAFEAILYPNNILHIPPGVLGGRPRRVIITVLDDEITPTGEPKIKTETPNQLTEIPDDFSDTAWSTLQWQEGDSLLLPLLSETTLALTWSSQEEEQAWSSLNQLPSL